MRKTIALLFALFLLLGTAACSETNEAIDKAQAEASQAVENAPDVDWSKYGDDTRDKIRDYIAEDNCSGLNKELDKLDEGQDTQLVAFLKRVIEKAGCA